MIYLPEEARFGHLLSLPEGANIGQAVNDAMRAIEKENPDLADVLPKTYQILDSRTLASLLKVMASIPMDKGGDTFGLIYEYFLGKFAMSEGQKGGEFYTPTSIVRLIVEILEPYHGRIFDPACGSGGMFIQSARFVEDAPEEPHRGNLRPRPGARHRYRPPRPAEPRRPRAERRHQAGEHLLRGSPGLRRPLRLRAGESALQCQQDRQGTPRRTIRATPSASRAPTMATTSGSSISTPR